MTAEDYNFIHRARLQIGLCCKVTVLPEIMKQGLISSAQMVRFLSVNARPTITRKLSRMAPQSVSRAFIGR